EFRNRIVLIREDFNVPVRDGVVVSDARIRAALPSLKQLLDSGAKQILIASHLGRPEEGVPISAQPEVTLAPVAERLSTLLGEPVRLVDQFLDGQTLPDDRLVLLENIRLCEGEKANDAELSKQLADLCDVFVMDAFGTAHRAQASTAGVIQYATSACAGPLLQAELEALGRALASPQRPLMAVVGGSKVSTKLEVLLALSDQVDALILGGGIANTFLAAEGYAMGQSLYEPELMASAREIMNRTRVPLPTDVVVADGFSETANIRTIPVSDVRENEMVLDVGPETAAALAKELVAAQTIIWNGPLGVFEMAPFAEGTRVLAEAIARSNAFSIAGGGDTLAAIELFGVTDQISYISTGGGAFLEFVEGKTLPAVAALAARRT
ncbi:MAG: phosphoglycerate kinase, partial [Pseudomonadales bacterium]